MKLVSLAVLAANAIALVNAGNINWKDFDLPSQFMAGGAILNVNKQVNTSGAGGCAVAVAGCLGAALGFCICVAGPQSAVCTASALPGIIGSFFMTTFTQAVYECNQIPLVGITARDIRCTAAKSIRSVFPAPKFRAAPRRAKEDIENWRIFVAF
ncbi:hypothetical protein BGZ94_007015 [Podila epigama]|nr:hypothetical protein BGZ94_007015 [Podila epigama]